MNHYVTLALTNSKSCVYLHALYSPRTALRMFTPRRDHLMVCLLYSGHKVTASLGNVTVRGEKRWKGQGASMMANSLSMYSITENIYCSQLSSVAILLQPEPVFTSYSTRKWMGSLSPCAIALRSFPPSHVSTYNGQRSSQLFCVHCRYLLGVHCVAKVRE
jgi:hypothetical protein